MSDDMDDPFGKPPEDEDMLTAAWFLLLFAVLCGALWFYSMWKSVVEK